MKAGYSHPKQQAYRLLRRPDVVARLGDFRRSMAQEQASREERLTLDGERTRLEIARVAYLDPRQLFTTDGEVRPLHELDADCAAAVAGFEMIETYTGDGAQRRLVARTWRYKFHSKLSALDMAARITGVYQANHLCHRDVRQMTDEELKARALVLLGIGASGEVQVSSAPRLSFTENSLPIADAVGTVPAD